MQYADAGPQARVETPPVTSSLDVEVDLDVLRTVPKEFAIDSDERANWLLRKIIGARQYADRVKAYAELEQRRAAREEQTLLYLFGRQLEAWAKSEIAKFDGRRKSLSLPAATVGYRTLAPKLVIDDEQAVLTWAHEHCTGAVVSVQKLAKSVLDDHVRNSGEIPASGAHVDPGGERFFIK